VNKAAETVREGKSMEVEGHERLEGLTEGVALTSKQWRSKIQGQLPGLS
jgi:hypothetical protein